MTLVVTGDLDIIQNENLIDILRKDPKYREHIQFMAPGIWVAITRYRMICLFLIMDACEAYARRRA